MEDRMLSDEVLLALIKKNSGGGGGTSNYNSLSNKPEINGVTLSGDKSASDLSLASLDANGKVPTAQLPSYVDDVINGYLYEGHFYEDSAHTTEITGESGKIYVDLESNKTYRWSGLAFVEISESLALGETASTAYAGDKGKANADAITAIKDGQTIDSFSDVETALAGKQDTLTFDSVPTDGSTNPVESNGVYDALASKADASAVKKEFLGTLEEWDALTTAEKKAYDTYQITNDFTGGSGLPNYSTTEVNTGVKWIDGKDIYRKVVEFGALPNATVKTVSSGLTNVNAIRVYGIASRESDGAVFPLPYVVSDSVQYQAAIVFNNTTGNIDISTATNRSNMNAYVVLEYTKTA